MNEQHASKTEATIRQDDASRRQLGTEAKVRLFATRFRGRQDVYGSYDPVTSRVFQVKEPVTRDVLLAHLQGIRR